jgi:hypothetical protein
VRQDLPGRARRFMNAKRVETRRRIRHCQATAICHGRNEVTQHFPFYI